jgi:excinuclease ABC subunit C
MYAHADVVRRRGLTGQFKRLKTDAMTEKDHPDATVAGPQPPEPVATASGAPATGPGVIQRYLKRLPGSPGVYRMLDVDGQVIYVGKARSLKARVSNYARFGGHTNRIARMIAVTASMEFVTVRTEAEALLLEANLIKRFKPRFNVLMRDDKSFPYILIRRDTRAPQILKHRGARNVKGDYFGPFASAGAVSRAVNTLQRAFLLRSCSDSVFESRTRPCLLFQIKRCSAPCTGEIADTDYARLVEEACRFLRGESQDVRTQLKAMMLEASDKLEFERAAGFRNRLQAIAHVTADQSINPDGTEEADIFAAYQEGGQTCIQVFFFRTGQNWGNRAYFPKADRSLPVGEVLEAFVAQFYDDKPVPRLILLSHDFETRDLMAEALGTKTERRVEIRVPQRGTKIELVEHALANAREALGRRLAESSSQRRLLEALAERFELAAVPRRIEVYDNSHIMGTHAVGCMIVAGAEGFAKGQYRKFNMKSESTKPGDDYAMMREMLTRRFKRVAAADAQGLVEADPSLASSSDAELDVGIEVVGEAPASRLQQPAPPPRNERGADAIAFGVLRADDASDVPDDANEDEVIELVDPAITETGSDTDADTVAALAEGDDDDDDNTDLAADAMPDRPDLVLIDGGLGQLSVAQEVFRDLGITGIALVGVAKGPDRDAGREHFHIPGRHAPLMLEPRDPVLYFVQRLRDEAHRFAIGTHRAKRSKAIGINPLDEIPGIGPTRKRALLTHFGSAKAVSRAGIGDLKAVGGISAEMAQKIYDFFHEGVS